MTIALSPHLKDAIRKRLDDIEANGNVLDAYKCAAQIQEALPDGDVDLEDIVAAMLAGRGSIQAIELSPPALIIDFILPLPDEDHEPREPTTAAQPKGADSPKLPVDPIATVKEAQLSSARSLRLQIMLDVTELDAIENWRFKKRMPSRAAAVREIIRRGLAADGSVALAGKNSSSFGAANTEGAEASAAKKSPKK